MKSLTSLSASLKLVVICVAMVFQTSQLCALTTTSTAISSHVVLLLPSSHESEVFNIMLSPPPCTAPTVPVLGASSTSNCGTVNTTLTITSGVLNNASAWKWYSGSCGGSLVGTGSSIVVAPAVTTAYYARGEGGCVVAGSCGSITITVNAVPTVSVYPQPQVVCNGASSGLSLTSNVSGCSFTWGTSNLSGSIIGNNPCTGACGSNVADILTNLITVSGSVGYAVTAVSPAGCASAVTNAVVNLSAIPVQPVAILGPNIVCGLTTATYSIAPVAGATGYAWTLPTGPIQMNITSGQGTTQIVCSVPAGTLAVGDVTVTASNTCGTGVAQTLSVIKKPLTPGAISGPTSICGFTSATYSVAPVFGATSYTWTLPTGMTIASGTGTTQITASITSTFVAGLVKVSAVNACGAIPGTALNVTGNPPTTPLYIYGSANACSTSTATYSCSTVLGATGYSWSVPTAMAILSGQGTSLINVSYNPTLLVAGQTVAVQAYNICGLSAARALVMVTTSTQPGVITGPANTCSMTSATYSIVAVTGAVSYTWTPAVGQTITSGQGTTQIVVSVATSTLTTTATSYLKVLATNGCNAASTQRTLLITRCLSPEAMTATQELVDEAEVKLYPNPAAKEFRISDFGERMGVIEIYSLLGERVMQLEVATQQSEITIDVSELSNGLYFVRMMGEGMKPVNRHLVVAH